MQSQTKRQRVAPPPLPRCEETTKNKVLECGQCGLSWNKSEATRSYLTIPCQGCHILCPVCFSSVMAAKGAMHFYTCPCCQGEAESKEKHTHWHVHSPQQTRRKGGERQKVEMHRLSPPDPTLNPVLYHHSNNIMNSKCKSVDADNHFTLSLSRSTTSKGDKKKILHAISIPLPTKNIDSTISDDNRKKLIVFFQLLHPVLVLSSKQAFQDKYDFISSDSESGKTLFDAASVDDTCLFQCIYSLATGSLPPSGAEIEALQSTARKNMLVQIFGIAEMIRSHCTWKGRSILKDFVGQQLMINCAPQALYRILNQLGVSNSNETVRVNTIKDSKSKILAGYPLAGKKYDLFLILFDNLGFRVRGGKNLKVGYDQYTAIELVNIPKATLIDWGIYPNKEKNTKGKFNFSKFCLNRIFYVSLWRMKNSSICY